MNTNTQKVMFSSKSDNWSTPQGLYDLLNLEFNFTLDPCADSLNAKCAKFYTQQDDGLAKDWSREVVFCNPPYSQLAEWVKKAKDESMHKGSDGAVVAMLIPARTDTRTFHNDILPYASEIRFVKGRLKFGNQTNPAPFPSMIVVFRPFSMLFNVKVSSYERN